MIVRAGSRQISILRSRKGVAGKGGKPPEARCSNPMEGKPFRRIKRCVTGTLHALSGGRL